MVSRIEKVLMVFAVGLSGSQAGASSLALLCTSLENPTKLNLNIDSPNPNDKCDIAYEEDCGRTIGSYDLEIDLSLPSEMSTDESGKEQFVDTFNESEQKGLDINHEGRFRLRLGPSFRNELRRSRKTSVTVTSYESVQGAEFTLTCTAQL